MRKPITMLKKAKQALNLLNLQQEKTIKEIARIVNKVVASLIGGFYSFRFEK
jgi:hypothetical protein